MLSFEESDGCADSHQGNVILRDAPFANIEQLLVISSSIGRHFRVSWEPIVVKLELGLCITVPCSGPVLLNCMIGEIHPLGSLDPVTDTVASRML